MFIFKYDIHLETTCSLYVWLKYYSSSNEGANNKFHYFQALEMFYHFDFFELRGWRIEVYLYYFIPYI